MAGMQEDCRSNPCPVLRGTCTSDRVGRQAAGNQLLGQLDAIEVMNAYGNKTGGLPFTVLVDPSGSIVACRAGILEEPAATALLDRLL